MTFSSFHLSSQSKKKVGIKETIFHYIHTMSSSFRKKCERRQEKLHVVSQLNIQPWKKKETKKEKKNAIRNAILSNLILFCLFLTEEA
jgi:hypothetical protein